ncbi:CsbD family protein [Lacticaseibacillus daqingensis]|uniref:CsbD family protein n=1 Tax=Lacticaseibacillus daqingensis TaxID=2486014 RepID=UPI000F769BAC|nr:CsbD family protein [Lacticaseibacillus daqingensis]
MTDFDSLKDKVVGKVKETAGKLTNNEQLEAKGKAEQLKDEAAQKADEVTDKVKDKVDDVADDAAKKFNDAVDHHRDQS